MVTKLHSSLSSHFSRESKQEDIGGFSSQSSLWEKKNKTTMQSCIIFIYEAKTGTGDLIIYKKRGEHGTVGKCMVSR